MDATLSGETTAQAQKQTTKEYKSPPHALIWFFRKSRDLWKSKYQELQASIKRLKNRVADVTKSREQWKLKAEQTNNQLTVLEAENASLHAQIATLAEKKNDQAVQELTFDSAEQHVPQAGLRLAAWLGFAPASGVEAAAPRLRPSRRRARHAGRYGRPPGCYFPVL